MTGKEGRKPDEVILSDQACGAFEISNTVPSLIWMQLSHLEVRT